MAQPPQRKEHHGSSTSEAALPMTMPCGFDLSTHSWIQRTCDTKGHVNPEDKRVREIENRIPASAEQPAAMQGSEPIPEERAKKLADNLKRQRSSANSES